MNTWSSSYTELKNAPGGYLVALRDSNRDGKADRIERFGPVHQDGKVGGGTGIAVHRGALFVEDNGTIVRYRLAPTTSGQPSEWSIASPFMSSRLCPTFLPKPKPGSIRTFSRLMPASCAAAMRSSSQR